MLIISWIKDDPIKDQPSWFVTFRKSLKTRNAVCSNWIIYDYQSSTSNLNQECLWVGHRKYIQINLTKTYPFLINGILFSFSIIQHCALRKKDKKHNRSYWKYSTKDVLPNYIYFNFSIQSTKQLFSKGHQDITDNV